MTYISWSKILPYVLKKIIWYRNTILWDCESVWPDVWPKINVGHWPLFHGPVILPYILTTIQQLNIILWDYELVWPDVWSQNIFKSLWPKFHGPVILPDILKTIRSQWPIFHGLVIFLLSIFCSEKHFSFIGKEFRQVKLSCDSSYSHLWTCY